jgi:membrane-bound ClpP family serine protease
MRKEMSRGTGTGLIGLGIVLVVIGAILKFAVTVTTTGFNVNAVGVILLVVGICSVVMGGTMFALSTNRRTTTRESVQYTPGGSERVVEHHDVMP